MHFLSLSRSTVWTWVPFKEVCVGRGDLEKKGKGSGEEYILGHAAFEVSAALHMGSGQA